MMVEKGLRNPEAWVASWSWVSECMPRKSCLLQTAAEATLKCLVVCE